MILLKQMVGGKGSETTTQRSMGQQPEGKQETDHYLKRKKTGEKQGF